MNPRPADERLYDAAEDHQSLFIVCKRSGENVVLMETYARNDDGQNIFRSIIKYIWNILKRTLQIILYS